MASDSSTSTALLFACSVLFSSQASLAYFSASFQTEGEVSLHPVKGFRNRRQVCADGTYEHGGKICCLCAAGQRLERHCSATHDDGQCMLCDSGTYNSHPNSLNACEPCRSCDHPHANLVVVEPCTRARNAECGCKTDHFCISGTETCRLCQPCKVCGTEGVRVGCTATNNTVCNDRTEGLNGGSIAAIIVSVLLIATLIGAAALFYKYMMRRKMRSRNQTNSNAAEVELLRLKELDLHVPAVADVLGWKDMKDVAMRSGIPQNVIDSCKLDHQGDSEEWTLQLLRKWSEKHGRGASNKLIEILQDRDKHLKAEKVKEILQNDSTAVLNAPV